MSPSTNGCVVGIDPGERWIGVARAAYGSSLALPVGTIDRLANSGATADALKALLGAETVSELVVGVPLRPDGREDAQAQSFRKFGEALAESLGAICVPQDERFSSEPATGNALHQQWGVGRKSRERGRKSARRQQRDRERAHAEAAARILQRWLDARDGERARVAADDGS